MGEEHWRAVKLRRAIALIASQQEGVKAFQCARWPAEHEDNMKTQKLAVTKSFSSGLATEKSYFNLLFNLFLCWVCEKQIMSYTF